MSAEIKNAIIESAESDPVYKPGAVKAVSKRIRAAVALTPTGRRRIPDARLAERTRA